MQDGAISGLRVAHNEHDRTDRPTRSVIRWSDRMYSDVRTRRSITQRSGWQSIQFPPIPYGVLPGYKCDKPGTNGAVNWTAIMSDREAKARAVKILAKSIF